MGGERERGGDVFVIKRRDTALVLVPYCLKSGTERSRDL